MHTNIFDFSDECGVGTGIKCHADANCELNEDGVPECRCKTGLYGDGITSCSSKSTSNKILRTPIARTLMARFYCLTRTRSWVPMVP